MASSSSLATTTPANMHRIVEDDYLQTGDLEGSLSRVLPDFRGAYSLVISTPDRLIAARDPQGFRPLHLGRYATQGWVVASEVAALDIINADPVREITPGEILSISGTTPEDLRSITFAEADTHVCGFEYVYFSRPDNEMEGELVYDVRFRMGELLGARDDVEADMVLGVPNSGLIAARGYSFVTGIPYYESLVRNNYVDRTFIAPTQEMRVLGVKNKINPIRRHIAGKRLVVVDDSIIRATTTRELVIMLQDMGAAEVHLRITSPPYKHPCYYGMDTGRKEELIAARMSIEQIRKHTDADSLMYLEDEDLTTAMGKAAGHTCNACTTGDYPVSITSRR